MTSKNLFSEKKACGRIWGLMKEDIKRRIWVLTLMFLAFFFALPVKLALVMENARRMEFRAYNDYESIEKLLPEHFTAKQYETMTAFFKREVVLDEISYGNGLMVFLFLMAAVVVGVTAFSYLHNKKKVDFYHSIPVRREVLFAVQYGDGILIPAAAYLFGCLLFTAVAAAYGVPVSEFFGPMAAAFGMNLLYYSLVYGTVTVAMMMTGNIVIGLLGTAVFFGFVPMAAGLLGAFADQFFVTSAGEFWYADSSPYLWAMQNLSPVGAYIWSAASVSDADGIKMAEVLKAAACMMAVTALSLELYRLRPSEAAGKAMAFSKSKAPIRILLVLLGGMAGGWFFWTLQSQVKWGLFGTAAGILLVHCMVEIIYHFDFKKLFSHKMQLALCLGAGMLFFCSFRYDWYGYDSYVPSQEEIASASVDLSIDHSFTANMPRVIWQGDTQRLIYESAGDFIKEKMELTDSASVLALTEAASKEAAGYREEKLNRWEAQIGLNGVSMSVNHYSSKDASAISVIGGADGPTSVFVAGKEGDEAYDRYFSQVLIRYRLKNGRQVSRRYHMDLEDVLETYENIYNNETYKKGLYPILTQQPEEMGYVSYRENGNRSLFKTMEEDDIKELLGAYQTDLKAQKLKDRMREDPVGALQFAEKELCLYIQERWGKNGSYISEYQRDLIKMLLGPEALKDSYNEMPSADEMERYMENHLDQLCRWPVYPSFTNTIQVLEKMGIEPGAYFTAEHVSRISVDVSSVVNGKEYSDGLPEGEALKRIQKENPFYQEDGTLVFTEPEQIELLMGALRDRELADMNGMREPEQPARYDLYVTLTLKDESRVSAEFWPDDVTPEMEALFKGLR